ncbi:MAG: DUF4870 domain-containing protein [Planctomycetaceae bacterium]|nr:DUF4870 domain-containing protein [Planctomycetaceae bacterium]
MTSDFNAPEMNIPAATNETTDVLGMQSNTYCMLLHLSQLLNVLLPPFGIITPIIMWAIAKDKHAEVDAHGKVVLNWLISWYIYMTVAAVLVFVAVGVLLIPALMILMFVFPILGAVKANTGVVWRYPLSIPLFK